MSVLETFLILFESDAEKAKKDVDDLNESLDGSEESANNAADASEGSSKAFLGMGKKALGAVGGIVALTSAITGLIVTSTRLKEIGVFAELTGQDVGQVDAWGGAVKRVGGTAEGFQGTIDSLNGTLTEFSITGQSTIVPLLNFIGVRALDANNKVNILGHTLPELADAFQRMGNQRSLAIGKKLGLDVGTIALLQKGREEVDRLIARQEMLGVANEEAAKLSKEFVNIMADFKQVTGFAAQNLLVNFVPAVTWTIDKLLKFSEWSKENKPVVIGFFAGLGAVAIPVLWNMAVAGWAAVAPFLVMAAPFIAIAAAAAAAGIAISIVIEDIAAFVNGQDSLIGDIIEKWPIVGDIIKFISDDVSAFIKNMKTLAGVLVDVFMAPAKALKGFKQIFDIGKNLFGFGSDEEIELNKNILLGQGNLALATNSPLASQTSNSIVNSMKSNSKKISIKTGDTTINTQATDAEGIAKEYNGQLEEQVRSTIENFDDGILI